MTLNDINILLARYGWAWQRAVEQIFAPRGICHVLAEDDNEVLNLMSGGRVHTAIIDMDTKHESSIGLIKMMRRHYPSVPCILVSGFTEQRILAEVLGLDVFSVIAKPVDMGILQEMLNRLFTKRYNSMIFSQ